MSGDGSGDGPGRDIAIRKADAEGQWTELSLDPLDFESGQSAYDSLRVMLHLKNVESRTSGSTNDRAIEAF